MSESEAGRQVRHRRLPIPVMAGLSKITSAKGWEVLNGPMGGLEMPLVVTNKGVGVASSRVRL